MSNTQAHYSQGLINTINLSIKCPRLAGRVAYFLQNCEVLTQDQWVLQTVAGYHLELTEATIQERVPHQIRCSPESKSQDILRGSGALIQRGNGRDTALPKQLCVPDFPGGKEGQGLETSDKLGGSQPICEGRTLQDEGSSLTFRSPTTIGLDGKDGLQGCIPSSAHPSKSSTISSPSNWRRKLTSFSAYLSTYQLHPGCLQNC